MVITLFLVSKRRSSVPIKKSCYEILGIAIDEWISNLRNFREKKHITFLLIEEVHIELLLQIYSFYYQDRNLADTSFAYARITSNLIVYNLMGSDSHLAI